MTETLLPRDAARLVLAGARARVGPDAAPDAALGLALRTLRATLGRWVGADAFDSLVDRACVLANDRNPTHPELAWRPVVAAGRRELVAAAGGAWDPTEGGEAVIEALAEILARFVGDALARQLLLEALDIPGDHGRT